MYKNDAVAQKMRLVARKFWNISYFELDDEKVTEITPLYRRAKKGDDDEKKHIKMSIECDNFECASNPWRIIAPREILRWPITFMLWCTIPDCRRFQKYYILTFINCVAWILVLSFVISSMIAIVGK